MALDQSIMGEATVGRDDSQSHKKRKLDHRLHRAMGEQTERLAAANGHDQRDDERLHDHDQGPAAPPDDKQRVLRLLEPFTREQLMEILTTAATQHDDVLHEIKAVANADVAHRKVFVRGLAWETTTERLTAAFSLFGEVEEGAVIFDKSTGKSRGYGFVTFVDMEGAQRAVEKQALEIDGRRATCNLAAVRAQGDDHQHHQVHPQYAHPQYQAHAAGQPMRVGAPPAVTAPYTVYTTNMQPAPAPVYVPPPVTTEAPRGQNDEAERKLFVRGLSWDTTDESLRAEFIKFGELAEASVVRERKTGKSKGFGFVTFRHRAAAAAALQQPHKVIDGRSVTCNLASLGRTSSPGSGAPMGAVQAQYLAPSPYPGQQPPLQPDMGGYTVYAQPPPPAVDPYRQQQYAYAGAPPPLPPTQQYYYPPAAAHAPPQGRRH